MAARQTQLGDCALRPRRAGSQAAEDFGLNEVRTIASGATLPAKSGTPNQRFPFKSTRPTPCLRRHRPVESEIAIAVSRLSQQIGWCPGVRAPLGTFANGC